MKQSIILFQEDEDQIGEEIDDDYIIFDCPGKAKKFLIKHLVSTGPLYVKNVWVISGQIELYTHMKLMQNLVSQLHVSEIESNKY